MSKEQAFTLIEVLIAISLSTFIIFAMTQIYRNAVRYLSRNRELMALNRKGCLLFDQLEKDLSCAFIPELRKKNEFEQKKGEEKEEKRKERKKEINLFTVDIYEGETRRMKGKRWELFKKINFITTNPLLVFEQNRRRIVRVMYELVKDREKSTKEKISYNLFRKETLDLENEDFLHLEKGVTKGEEDLIHTYLVADNIKDFYMQCVELRRKNEAKRVDREEYEEISTFVWGDDIEKERGVQEKKKKKKSHTVPQRIEVRVNFWDEALESESTVACSIPIFSYSIVAEEKKEPEKPKKETPKEKPNTEKKESKAV